MLAIKSRIDLGKILQSARRNANIKQTDMAKLLGKSLKTVSNYECGITPIPAHILIRWIEILEAQLSEFGVMDSIKNYNDSESKTGEAFILGAEYAEIEVEDNSFPDIKQGSRIVYKRMSEDTFKSGRIYIISLSGDLKIARLQKIDQSGRVKIFYDNPSFESSIINENDVQIIGLPELVITNFQL